MVGGAVLKQKEMDKAGGARAKELAAQAEELKAARAQVRPKPQAALVIAGSG